MERNLERQTLSFSKGMTNVPSDLLSDDSELLESDGFIFKDGEMKAVQKGVKITGGSPIEGKLVYVHKLADYRNLITYIEDGTKLKCYIDFKDNQSTDRKTQTIELGSKLLDIKHVGNTIVCATEEGIHYILYKGNTYKDLGKELPIPDISFAFTNEEEKTELEKDRTVCRMRTFVSEVKTDGYGYLCYDESGNFIGVKDSHDGAAKYTLDYHHIMNESDTEKYTNFQNAVKGHAAEAIEYTKNKNLFAFPFFIRTALRMFDGTTFARISNPIICYPSTKKNCKFGPCVYDSDKKNWIITSNQIATGGDASWQYMLILNYSHLNFKIDFPNKDDWKDIIKEVVVFASDDVVPFEIDSDWSFKTVSELNGKVYYDYVAADHYSEKKITFNWHTYQARELIEPVYKTERKIVDELLGKTQFYKLFSLELNSEYLDNIWHDASAYDETVSDVRIIPEGRLSNLKEQEQLKVDDYYGWTNLTSSKLFSYNNRINLIGVKRYPFKGFTIFRAGYTSPTNAYGFVKYYVHIVSQTMDTWVLSNALLIDKDYQTYNDWYFYPDPNAKEMLIMVNKYQEGKTYYYNINLQMHPMLNGSYSFAALPPTLLSTGKDVANKQIGGFEDLNSQIFTSVVNNPFVFEASGDNTVGTGKILGIIANTEAVSQGQFGQYPLMVFTDEGIYGLSVNSEGLYSRAYPISREVCNEDSPLVPTDRLVFFASKKGLMAASGGSVACMSEQMRGRVPRNFATFGEGKFLDFLKDCFIAYDYRDSILRIFSKGKSYQYIYNMVDKTFSMVNSGIEAQAVVNDYPDNLIQDTNGNVYSLTSKPEINEDTESYSGSFTTRPLKLGGSMTLKSLRAVKHLFDSDEGTIGLEIYGSNDCKHWCKLPSVGGKPWKYFTFKYRLQNFNAADSFAGSIVEVQSRREDKMR